MSPEFRRPSHGWAKHERERKAAKRKNFPPQPPVAEESPADIHWRFIQGTVTRAFHENPEMLKLFGGNGKFFRRFCDGRRQITLGLGSDIQDGIVEEYFQKPDSPTYNRKKSDFFDKAGPILQVITAETAKIGIRGPGGKL